MGTTAYINSNPIEPTIRALGQLSPSSQRIVSALVRQLAEREGINVVLPNALGIQHRCRPINRSYVGHAIILIGSIPPGYITPD